jgi:hypothetical protein
MHPFRAAVESGDLSSIQEMLAADVKLYSPIPFKPFEGRDTVWAVLQALGAITDEVEYTDEFTNDDAVALISRVRIGGREGEVLQLLRFAPDGKIVSITDMLRPQSAVDALKLAIQQPA